MTIALAAFSLFRNKMPVAEAPRSSEGKHLSASSDKVLNYRKDNAVEVGVRTALSLTKSDSLGI
jgi:hypothetical protein